MRSIRIIKPNRIKDENPTPTESTKPVELSKRKIVNTVKRWVAESSQRKRNRRRSLASLGFLTLIAFVVAMAQSPQQRTETPLTPEERAVKVTIATTDGFLGPPTKRYRVGQQIPVSISMTNASLKPIYTCISSDLYQDLPTLTRDGKAVPYMNWQADETTYVQRNNVCQKENLPEPVLLKPNEPTVADWLVLVDDHTPEGADAWYDPLPVGNYELTIERRLGCCDGPMIESNKISFEVVP
jgi:hypothetical protein